MCDTSSCCSRLLSKYDECRNPMLLRLRFRCCRFLSGVRMLASDDTLFSDRSSDSRLVSPSKLPSDMLMISFLLRTSRRKFVKLLKRSFVTNCNLFRDISRTLSVCGFRINFNFTILLLLRVSELIFNFVKFSST